MALVPFLTPRRAAFGAMFTVVAFVVVLGGLRSGTIPSPSGGPVEEIAAPPDSRADATSGAGTSGVGPSAAPAPVELPSGDPAAVAPEDDGPAGLLVAAAGAGDAGRVRELLAAGVAADSESGGSFAIHRAADSDAVPVLQVLVTAGAHLEAMDMYGNTALTRAAFSGNAEAVAFLVGVGADPNAYAEPNNQTPLMAILSGWTRSLSRLSPRFAPKEEERFKAAWVLIQAGADPHFGPGDHPPPVVLAKGIGGEIGRLYAGEATGPEPRPR